MVVSLINFNNFFIYNLIINKIYKIEINYFLQLLLNLIIYLLKFHKF